MAVTLDSSIPYKTILVKFGNHPNKDFVWFSTTINAWYEKNMNAAHGYSTTGKITRSTVLNTHRAKEFIVPSTIRRRITRAALFLKIYQVLFFNATHQVKAIAIAVSKVNPLVEISCLLWCVHLHVFFPTSPLISNKELSPHTIFIWVSIFYFLE